MIDNGTGDSSGRGIFVTMSNGNPIKVRDGYAVVFDDERGQKKFIERRHKEWVEWRNHWKFLLDSYEGGIVYSNAFYGWDTSGYPIRNLIRHKFEYDDPRQQNSLRGGLGAAIPEPGSDKSRYATNNDYELRRARTPVPTYFREAVETHLSKIYTQEVVRTGPKSVEDFWEDVDGKGLKIGDWMEQLIAPLGLTVANIDVLFDHPKAPDGEVLESRADEKRLGLTDVVASIILPENMVWWRLDGKDRYSECLVVEYQDDAAGDPVEMFRHWTAEQSQLFDKDGGPVGEPVKHPYGRPPIKRLFDQKRPRHRNVGQSRYEGTADKQREAYNSASEKILANTLQVHNLIQGPEDFVQSDGTIPIGPNWMLPKKKNTQGGSVTYEPFEVLTFPTAGMDSLRLDLQELRDQCDRENKLTKPAGTAGTGAGVMRQTAESKKLDNQDGGQHLTRLTAVLSCWEHEIAEMVLLVASNGNPSDSDIAAVEITYPQSFDLQNLDELTSGASDLQSFVEGAGQLPETEKLVGKGIVRKLRPGESEETYATIDKEMEDVIDRKANLVVQGLEGQALRLKRQADGGIVDEEEEPTSSASSQEDPTGSGGTLGVPAFP